YAGQVAQNQQGFNAWQNGGIQGAQNAEIRVLELGIKPGATTAEDWVILLGTAQPGQREGMLLIFKLSDLDEIEEVNANYILMANLQQTSTSGLPSMTQTAQLSMVHSGGTVETSSTPNEEIRAHQETVYRNLVDQVAQ
nr:hypothetical protein [Tanacetum cinerariifolium]